VLRNFISNAIKFSKEHSTIEVNVSSPLKGMIRFAVKDEGKGIRRNEIEKLFSKYSQTSSNAINKFEGTNMGTGLGLQISKHIIDLMQGEIGVESEYGKGSTFWFEIPIEVIIDEKDDNTSVKESKESKFNLNVLIVEDKLVNQKVAEVMMKSLGCEVDIANNGEEGVMAVYNDREKYDLILMDIQMPVMDGITATAEIRKLLGELCPKIVALSAKGMEGDAEYIKSNGLDDYLAKPVKLDQIKEMLNKYFS
jgi:CheY-like chemotaxis protein